MPQDSPSQRRRRPRSELKELMIQGGVEVLQQLGVETQLSSVSYAKVFEHVERTQGVRITYGSVHERIWNSLQEYQLAVIERAGVWDQASSPAGDHGWGDWLQTMVAMSSATDPAVAEAATNGARATYAARTTPPSPPVVELLPDGADPDALADILAVAVADGLQLRSFLTGDDSIDLIDLARAVVHEWAQREGPSR